MKIKDIKVKRVSIPHSETVVMAENKGGYDHITTLVIQLETDEGIVGVSEMPGWHGPDRWEFEIENVLKPQLIGEDPFNIERIVGTRYFMTHDAAAEHAQVSGPFLIASIEIACWDIIGKASKLPVYKLMGGRLWEKIPITRFIGIRSPEEAARDSLAAVKEGIKAIKLKVGLDPQQDIAIVKSVREAVGDDIAIRVDANQAWSVGTAINQINKMARYYPQYIEGPIPAWDWDGFLRIRRRTQVPLCVCETLHIEGYLAAILRLIQKQAVDFVSTDPWRTAGLLGFKKLCAICDAADIPVVMHWNTLGVSQAACLHACESNHATFYPQDILCINLKPGPVDDIVTRPLRHERGYLKVPEGPGLGVDLDEKKVEVWSKYDEEIRKEPAKMTPAERFGDENLPVTYYFPPRY